MHQIAESLFAIAAFIPLTVCPGYLAAWYSNLHNFRQRSLVERILWSIPLSFAVSPISSVLIGKFFSLSAVVICYFFTLAFWLATTVLADYRILHRARQKWFIGWRPMGTVVFLLATLWVALVVVSLVDFQSGQNLHSTYILWDHSARINWIESILHTGIPPQNSLYFFQHAAPMRNYYFWYVLCGVVSKACHLPARATLNASCAWAGFALASVIGLYLKHFLGVTVRLRRQFLLALLLLSVTGLDIFANVVQIFFLRRPLPLDLEWWSYDKIYSWYGSLLWTPHHLTALVCCFFAFLLAWISKSDNPHSIYVEVAIIAAALASAFGISVFVPFGFFLVILLWAIWQVAVERNAAPVVRLAAGGALALILLVPYLSELLKNSSSKQQGGLFAFSIREMLPVSSLTGISTFQSIARAHPRLLHNVAALLLLVPGYAIELGFYLIVLLVYLIPALRPRRQLAAPHRCLLVIALAAFPVITFIRSGVLQSNDFGWRAALILQFPLLLLASELLLHWTPFQIPQAGSRAAPVSPSASIPPVQFLARISLAIGVIGTIAQALMLRFDFPILENNFRSSHNQQPGIVSHNAYISYVGYLNLGRTIPTDAVVQFNPSNPLNVWKVFDPLNVNRQVALTADELWCGSELGGDPAGCPPMIAAIRPLFKGAPAAQARAVCSTYGIQFLVAKIYDPAWNDPHSWVWNLPPVVADPEFRALDCR